MHRIDIELRDHAAIVKASGELDAYAAPDLTEGFERARGHRGAIADLETVSFMDSTALGLVVKATRELTEAGADVRVVLPRGPARRIFAITTLDRVLPISPSVDAACAELASSSNATGTRARADG